MKLEIDIDEVAKEMKTTTGLNGPNEMLKEGVFSDSLLSALEELYGLERLIVKRIEETE